MADGGEIPFTPDQDVTTPTQDSIPFVPDNQEAAKSAHYGSMGQQALAGLEGIAKGVAGPLATKAEVKLGVPPEDITSREEANPITHGVGEALGLIAPALVPGVGEISQAGFLKAAGHTVTDALGLTGAKALATKLGVENALFSLGDEVSKQVVNNPDSVQTAAIKVGLSGLLGVGAGAGLGKLSTLWANRLGPKAEMALKDFTDTLKGGNISFEDLQGLEKPLKPSQGSKMAKKMVDSLARAAGEGVGDIAGATLGHMTGLPGAGWVGGLVGHYALAPLLKTLIPSVIKPLLTSDSSIVGLKVAFDAIDTIAKGETLAHDASKALFQEGSKSFFNTLIPDKDKLHSLDTHVEAIAKNPESMFLANNMLAHYMPGHQTALSATNQNAINYIQAQKPRPSQLAPLDKPITPSADALSSYYRTLGLAEQPLTILGHIYNGSLKPKDIVDLKALYPGLLPNITQKLNNQMIDHISKGKSVPFKLRKGIGMLMGQPMDSTFSQPSIMSAQATYAPPIGPQAAPQGPSTKKGTSNLGKAAQMAQTPQEKRNEALLKA